MHNYDQLFWGSLRRPKFQTFEKLFTEKIAKFILSIQFSTGESYDRANCDFPHYDVEF